MPYCSHCGNFVLDGDRFCTKCGQPQVVASPTPTPEPVPLEAAPPTPEPPPAPAAEPSPANGAPPVYAAAAVRQPLAPNIAAMLCYIPGMGWIASIIWLTLDAYKHDRYVRFHAFQGLFLAVLWLLVSKIFVPFPSGVTIFPFIGFRWLWKLAVITAQVVGIIKTVQNHDYRLPVLSDLAEKSMA